MQLRLVAIEDGKDPTFSKSSVLPWRFLHCLLFFLVLGLGFSIISMNTMRFLSAQTRNNVVVAFPVVESNTRIWGPKEPTGIESWIRHPSTLLHSMKDSELFWRAYLVPRIKEYPFHRVQKITFMFLIKGPLPLAPLCERFFKGHEGLYSIYLHSMPSYIANFLASSVFHKRQIPSQVAK